MADTKDLNVLLDARIPIVGIESPDELRVLEFLLRFAMQRSLSFYEWSVTRGLRLSGFGTGPDDEADLREPEDLLKHISEQTGPALYALCDFHPYLKDEPTNIRYLKDIALNFDY